MYVILKQKLYICEDINYIYDQLNLIYIFLNNIQRIYNELLRYNIDFLVVYRNAKKDWGSSDG